MPVKVKGLGPSARVVFLVAAFANSGALLADGRYLDWGTNGEGQLGIGTQNKPSGVPVMVHLPTRVRQSPRAGQRPATVRRWRSSPTATCTPGAPTGRGSSGTGRRRRRTLAGADHSTGRSHLPGAGDERRHLVRHLQDGEVYAWGGGKEGQIGNGTTDSSLIPVKVASGATRISATADDVLIAVTGS